MKIRPTFLMIVAGLVLLSCSRKLTPVRNNENDRQSQLIFNSIKSFPNNTEFSVALIKNGAVSFIGLTKKDDSIRFIENHQSAFEIGSLTKVFTATLLASLVVEEKLKLEDHIQDYLDLKVNIAKPITFRQLANHTSGLPRLPSNFEVSAVHQSNPFKHYNKRKLAEYLRSEVNLSHEPGTKYEYSNLGSGLLGFELAQITDSPYESLLYERIFNKYDMPHSTSNRETLEAKLINGLNPDGDITANWDFEALAGAGAIISTVEDLSHFALAQFEETNRELTLTQRPTFRVGNKMSIGLGWHILKRKKDLELIWHNGATGGYRSSMALDLERKNGVVILSNVSAFHKHAEKIDQLCFKLMEIIDES
ncbi:MAG: beta-lactamase family protein [Ekhidna sp.]|nr:beta-lactamase family protein [Ekhidna sp.]